MPLTSAMLRERFGASSTDLHRWTEYGWIEPHQPPHRRGSGNRLTWPAWAARIVALLLLPGEPERRRFLGSRQMHVEHGRRVCALAEGLIDYPDAPWFAWIDGAGMIATDTAAEAVRLVMECEPGPLRTLVSPPTI